MSEQKVHQLLLLFLGSCVAVFLVLLILEPILGILWALLIALVCVVFGICRPDVWRAEKERLQRRIRRIKASLMGDTQQTQEDAPEEYELVVVKPRAGRRYPVNRKIYLIGRSSQCDCRLNDAGTIGREHCRIVYREHSREYYIEDLRSKNGTYLGTRRLDPNTQIKLLENEEIFVGDYCLRFEKKQRG